jgi:DNA replication protein DnaC
LAAFFPWRQPRGGLPRDQYRERQSAQVYANCYFYEFSRRARKTFLARAFGHKACRDGFTALFIRAEQLFRELDMGRGDGSYGRRLREFSRVDVLIVDDWAMTPLDDSARRAFLEICDERYQNRSTMLTSQLPVSAWHAQIGDPTIADSILDRLVHNAHRIEMQGDSMRRKQRKDGKEKEGE